MFNHLFSEGKKEVTVCLIKPDAVAAGKVPDIIADVSFTFWNFSRIDFGRQEMFCSPKLKVKKNSSDHLWSIVCSCYLMAGLLLIWCKIQDNPSSVQLTINFNSFYFLSRTIGLISTTTLQKIYFIGKESSILFKNM